MKARRKGSLSQYVLLALEKAVDGYIRLEDFLYNPGFYAYNSWERPLKKSELAQALKRLREGGFVEEVKIGDDVVIKLNQSIGEFTQNKNDKWDGKWRVVVFDIPEQKRIVRNLFRRHLKKWGFKQLQKSVWISQSNCYDRLVSYIKDLGLKRYITTMEVEKLSST